MKPHCMFFDESYSEELYQSETIQAFMDTKMDAMIVIGTALQTGIAKRLVEQALSRQDVPVIEINTAPCIDVGFVVQVVGKSEEVLI